MNAEMKWLDGGPGQQAHLCVINRDGERVRAAAICNSRAQLTWRAATPESSRCATCLSMEASSREIIFVDPETSKRVTVREGKR